MVVTSDVLGAAVVTIASTGAAGSWVGPAVVGGIGGGIDYTAAGAAALRDRLAVVLYYACAISFVEILGWAPYIRAQVAGSYDWTMVGALISLGTHGALLVVFFNRPVRLAKVLAKKIKFAGTESDAIKINQTLLGWTVAAACSAPLSGDGGWGGVVAIIAKFTTTAPGTIVGALMHFLGG